MLKVALVFATITVILGGMVVLAALLLTPLQDWAGNVDQMDADRVLVVSLGLFLAIGLGVFGALVCGFDRGGSRSVLRILNVGITVSALLIGVLKWFPHFEGF